jgi:hypothetical protein
MSVAGICLQGGILLPLLWSLAMDKLLRGLMKIDIEHWDMQIILLY